MAGVFWGILKKRQILLRDYKQISAFHIAMLFVKNINILLLYCTDTFFSWFFNMKGGGFKESCRS